MLVPRNEWPVNICLPIITQRIMYATAAFCNMKYLCFFLKCFFDERFPVIKENARKMKGEGEEVGNVIEFERGNFTIVMSLCPMRKSIWNDLLYVRRIYSKTQKITVYSTWPEWVPLFIF